MSREGVTEFYTSMGPSSEQPSVQPCLRIPQHSSFLSRLKVNTKNRIIKYRLDKKQSVSTEDIFNKTGIKVSSLIKLQQQFGNLRLNVTNHAQSFRKTQIYHQTTSLHRLHTSFDKMRKTTDRFTNRSYAKICPLPQSLEKQIIKQKQKKPASSIPKTILKLLIYQELYGNIRDLDVELLIKIQYRYYMDFIWKVAYSNEHILQVKQKPRVFIGKGNNSKLVRSIMKNRWWWVVEKDESKADFIWTQLKISQIYHLQNNHKTRPPQQYKKTQRQGQLISRDPALKLMNTIQFNSWNNYLRLNIKTQRKVSQNLNSRKPLTKDYKTLSISKVTNHIQLSRMIGNKKALFYLMRQYYQLNCLNYTEYLPLTFHVVSGLQSKDYSQFLQAFNVRKRQKQQNTWIVKPGEMSNRGNGITVCNNLEQIKQILKSKKRHANGKQKTYIIQLYMSEPFLYKNRKFDIRHYLLVTSINGIIKGYWYEEGYIRTTSTQFSLNNLNGLVHLTNDAVQKYGKDYGKFEKGNKLSYSEFQSYLDIKYGEGEYKFANILSTMKRIATDVMRASYSSIDTSRKQHNFQIFGMDFMISKDWKPYLIQINTNPCLELSSNLLARIIPSMVDNALKIGLDPLFPPPQTSKKLNISQNRFELIFDEVTQASQIQRLYNGRKRIEQLLQDIGSDDEAYQQLQQDDI